MMESDHTPEASTNKDAQGDSNLTQPGSGEQPTSVEEHIAAIVYQTRDSAIQENMAYDATMTLGQTIAALLSLYQKELVEARIQWEHEAVNDLYKYIAERKRKKLKGEQP